MKHLTLHLTEADFNLIKDKHARPGVALTQDDGVVHLMPTLEMVDLGLSSGTLWAKTNIGAQTETDYGYYYQWAATTPLHVEGTGEGAVNPPANWSLCPYTNDGETFEKYNGEDYDTLQTEDDVVASQFTGYRMPTKDDFVELRDETNNEWTSINGVNGYKFTNQSDSSKYIFLPAAGYCSKSVSNSVGVEGCYWSSSIYTDYPNYAMHLYFNEEGVYINGSIRYNGFSVRPVVNPQNQL